jgi:hypothetical protein
MFKFRRKIKITSKGASNEIDWGEFFSRQKGYLIAAKEFIGKQKKYIIVSVVAGSLILFALILFLNFPHVAKNKKIPVNTLYPAAIVPDNGLEGQEAESLALAKAKEWHLDVILAYMTSSSTMKAVTDSWRLIFVSPTLKKRGYEITIKDKQIISAAEIDYSGQGGEFPAETEITQEQAIGRVRKIPGYENVKILKVEAIYGPTGKTWYWGVETDKGTVSVEIK